jgi:HK97 family phage major capsid protein
MSNRFLEGLRQRREELQTTIEQITNGAAEHSRDLDETELANVRGISEQLAPLDERIRQLNEIEEARIGYLDDARRVDQAAHGLRPQVHGSAPAERLRSWSEQFIEAGTLQTWRPGSRTRSEGVDVGPIFRGRADPPTNGNGVSPISSADFADTLLGYQELGIIELRQPPNMLSVLRTGTTTAGVIQYVQEEQPTYGAAVVPEGEPKSPTKFDFTPKTITVATIAHWVAATRQVLDDIPQLRAYIDGRLRLGLIQAIERFVLNGDATSGDPGLLASATSITATSLVDAVLQASAEITAYNYQPTAIIMNQRDWFTLLGQFLLPPGTGPGPGLRDLADTVVTDSIPPRLVGLPIVFTPTMPQGTILVGDFLNGAQLWDRQATTIFVSDSHDDLFIRNVIVILAEARLALAIYAPHAFAVAEIEDEGRRARTARNVSPSSSPPPPAAQPVTSSSVSGRRSSGGGI